MTILPPFSTIIGTSGSAERGVYAVCIPMDELFVDAGNQCPQHDSYVGHVFG